MTLRVFCAVALVACSFLGAECKKASSRPRALADDVPAVLPAFNSSTWPGGMVPYQIDAKFEQFEKDRIETTIGMMNSSWFCVLFRPKTAADRHFINFVRTDGKCLSEWIGFARHGAQNIYLSANCSTPRFIYFVVLQALGLPAEHMRPDRDDYVTVNWTNIIADNRDAFRKYAGIDKRLAALSYDMFSKLHYPNGKLAKEAGLQTISCKNDSTVELGNTLAPTLLDYKKLAALYCPGGTPRPIPTTTEAPVESTAADESHQFVTVAADNTTTIVDGWDDFTTAAPQTDDDDNSTYGMPDNPSGIIPSLSNARFQGLASASSKQLAVKTCHCLSQPSSSGLCDDDIGSMWDGYAKTCRKNPKAQVCKCINPKFNPCTCYKMSNQCVRKCAS